MKFLATSKVKREQLEQDYITIKFVFFFFSMHNSQKLFFASHFNILTKIKQRCRP